mgnify:CR=1 FL=1
MSERQIVNVTESALEKVLELRAGEEDADHLAHVVDLDVVKPMRNRVLDLVVRTRPAVVEPCRRELEAEPIARATSCAAVAEDATAGERRRNG